MYVSTIFRFWYACSRFILVPFSLAFCSTKIVRETLCKFLHIYAKQNVYLYNIMINRKLLGIFEFSLAPLRKRPIFLLFVFSLFLLSIYFSLKRKQKLKSTIFAVFAVICTFLSQIKCLFSVIYAYIGQTTPHTPVFGTRRVGQLSSENFLFFLFFIFCKIL